MGNLGHGCAVGKSLQRLGERCQWPRRGKGKGVSLPIPEHLNWFVWRPVVERIATLTEIMTYYDLVDLLDIHEALDLRDEVEYRATENT